VNLMIRKKSRPKGGGEKRKKRKEKRTDLRDGPPGSEGNEEKSGNSGKGKRGNGTALNLLKNGKGKSGSDITEKTTSA